MTPGAFDFCERCGHQGAGHAEDGCRAWVSLSPPAQCSCAGFVDAKDQMPHVEDRDDATLREHGLGRVPSKP